MTDSRSQGGRDDATALCIACGMCCDGSLFDRAYLEPNEVTDAKAAGMKPIEVDGRAKFNQPCAAFDSRCTCYHTRPKVCRIYRCKLLRQIDEAEISLGEALSVVDEARRLGAVVTAGYAVDETPTDARQRWLKLFERKNPGDDPHWYLAMTSYNLFLDRYFRGKFKAVMAEE